ncbi:MAG: bifunctional phosphoribosylaminoimidazolecarboxamide formyltransferase/IMP cyclohydrolase [Armatimonadota bacterium]|nr:bifunctional phosphoribosylaminoimidazolecarboxamide formyltransferase/IMP cyclohydrolase [Armatimonadota bacterium]MDR7408741.1 bifunctional phosphoribosylaminoimidazolecarboxamide formyltransferase/IMP cyclohydrolase [Armatimonadota bacterium]MDR7410734.1 bifunctional phosphoribosylaminoimidazolecarboxamide formyltransferase/IMP cyclohydrolase [Armatimonadota bacterium]MDR7424256.1 bifunctional phosphoribosylaminoimidazolecarboxamide formyltransferase/IMP cyclohydrolase [Armatimonadota bact
MARRAILSVTDKTGIVEFAAGLRELGWELVSTGGTARALAEAGLPVIPVQELTGFPELLAGRVKTLHPAVHAAVLARPQPEDLRELGRFGIEPVDLVACNLYRFEQAARGDLDWDELVEHVDIGGVTLIRAAAKNAARVTVLTDPAQYPEALALLRARGEVPLEVRRRWAAQAFLHTAYYDAVIAQALASRAGVEPFGDRMVRAWRKVRDLRYGENPHQRAAVYREPLAAADSLAACEPLGGKELSYNNLLDAGAAWALACEFAEPAAVVVKHTNPCGCAAAATLGEAVEGALRGDPVSAFGGIVATNRPVDRDSAARLQDVFLEVVVAPGFEPEALEVLRRKRNLRLLTAEPGGPGPEIRTVPGGVLVQEPDRVTWDPQQLRVVTTRHPTEEEWRDLAFAWTVCKHTKSNAIVLARGREVVGVGAGQMSRVDSVRMAVWKAKDRARGAVLASDAFFPFPDGVEEAARAGVVAIVQPGGSVRDPEVVAAAERAGCAMVFTGVRHFRH